MEANVEYRFRIIGDLHGAVFLDAGNVWLMRKDDSRPGGELTLKNFAKQVALVRERVCAMIWIFWCSVWTAE